MTSSFTWYQGSNDPQAAAAFEQIRQWWQGLNGREILWQQRMVQGTTDCSLVDWSYQHFDERFLIKDSEIRGITLYWLKTTQPNQQQSITPRRLELTADHRSLYVFPSSHQGLVLHIGPVRLDYSTIELTNPTIERSIVHGNFILRLKDEKKHIAVTVTMDPETLLALKKQLP